MQNHAGENRSDKGQGAEGGGGILRGRFGAPDEQYEKEERKMNPDFDSEQTSGRDGPTAHGGAYQYSIYLFDARLSGPGRVAKRKGSGGWRETEKVERERPTHTRYAGDRGTVSEPATAVTTGDRDSSHGRSPARDSF